MAAGYSGPQVQVHRQTIQKRKTAWPQAQGRASPPGYFRHLWLLLPGPQSSATVVPAIVPGASTVIVSQPG